MKKGFTLAEVLITLGIIGVVAAMTLPAVIQKHNQRVLETSFKKSYSEMSQAFYAVDADTLASVSNDTIGISSEFYKEFFSKFKIINGENNENSNAYPKKQKFYSYTKRVDSTNSSLLACPQLPRMVLTDGSFIGGMYNCWTNWLVIDTNGRKSPNAYGHDIFIFFLEVNKRKIIPAGADTAPIGGVFLKDANGKYCSGTSTSPENGATCAAFAVANTCPEDPSKTYWECLP